MLKKKITKKKLTAMLKESETYSSENVANFKALYNIDEAVTTTTVVFCITRFIKHKDRLAYTLLGELGIDFEVSRYKKYLEFRTHNKFDSVSLEFFKLKYGTNIGTIKFKERARNKTPSLKLWVEKYGKLEGTSRWNHFCERNKGNHSLERAIEIHGENGRTRFEENNYKLRNKNKLDYLISVFGKELGSKKYYDKNKKNSDSSKAFAKTVPPDFYDKTSLKTLITVYGDEIGTEKYKELTAKISIAAKRNWADEQYIKKHNASMEKAAQKIRKTNEDRGRWVPLKNVSDFDHYKRAVRKVTEAQDLNQLKNYHLRGARRSKKDAYELDHKISMLFGFLNNIPAQVIGNLDNLQFIHWKENATKGADCYSIL